MRRNVKGKADPRHRSGVRRPRALARRGPKFVFTKGVHIEKLRQNRVHIVIRISSVRLKSLSWPNL